MKQIVLVNIPKEEDKVTMPLGILYVGGALKKAGYDVKVFHFTIDEMDIYLEKILELNPLFIGFSVITGEKTRASSIFSKAIKNEKDIPIVWGGVHPSLLPNQTIGEDYVDYIVLREGEKTIVELAKALEGEMEIDLVKGIGYKENNKIKFTEQRPLMNQDELDTYEPDRELLNVEDFFIEMWGCKRILNIATSRGCCYSCRFCYNNQFNESKWRARSVGKVVKEINKLKKKYKIDGINIVDDFFFVDKKRAFDILEQIDLPWFGEMRIDLVDEELVDKLVKTKARQILIGFESGSNRMLKHMNKGFNVGKIKKGVKLLSKHKELRVSGSFIMGLPGETQIDLYKTIDLILELIEIHPEMRYSFGIYMPYPGSEIYEEAIKKGFNPPKRTEDWAVLERGSKELKVEWSDWEQDTNYYQNVRSYAQLLPIKKYRIPYFGNLPEKRLMEKDFEHNLELKFLTYLQRKFATQGGGFRKVVSKCLPFIKK